MEESWQGFQAQRGGDQLRSGESWGARCPSRDFKGSAEEEWGWGLSGLSPQAIRAAGTLRILPSPLSVSSLHDT